MAYHQKRRGHDDDEDCVSAKRRKGASDYDQVHKKIEDIIARVGSLDSDKPLVNDLEDLCATLETNLDTYRVKIIDIITNCIQFMPDRLTIYSTLVGLLNAKNFNFGGEIVEKLMSELHDKLEAENYQQALYIVLFLCDLGNCRVLTLNSISEFLESLVQAAFEDDVPQVRTDWFIFACLHSMPWIGSGLKDKRSDELGNILEGCEKYIEGRKKTHMNILQVWSDPTTHAQEDYLDSLWAQVSRLRDNDWKEKHIARHYISFDAALQDALQHNLANFSPPSHKEESNYPYPTVVFRLFDNSDCPRDEETKTILPDIHAIERFLAEEEILWIIEHNCLDRKLCAQLLLNYANGSNVPISYIILEVIFGQLFRLPTPPQPFVFYGVLILELCKAEQTKMPSALETAVNHLFDRADTMQPICIDRFVDWFSYNLSNMKFRWDWASWNDSLRACQGDKWNRKLILLRETIQKCLRFSYYDEINNILPPDFKALMPLTTEVIPIMDLVEDDDLARLAITFQNKFTEKVSDDAMTDMIRGDDGQFDPNAFAAFFSVMLKLACKSLSHNFAALTRYHRTLKLVADSTENMQLVLLKTLFDSWKNNPQMIQILVDKLLKMQILDCGAVVGWLFSEDMKDEFDRQWVWEVLNVALERLSRHASKVKKDTDMMRKQVNGLRRGDDEPMEDDDKRTRMLEELSAQEEKYESLREFQKSLYLDCLHKFTLLLCEYLNTFDDLSTMEYDTKWYRWIVGRFKHVFLIHCADLSRFTQELNDRLFLTTEIKGVVLESYQEFVALRE